MHYCCLRKAVQLQFQRQARRRLPLGHQSVQMVVRMDPSMSLLPIISTSVHAEPTTMVARRLQAKWLHSTNALNLVIAGTRIQTMEKSVLQFCSSRRLWGTIVGSNSISVKPSKTQPGDQLTVVYYYLVTAPHHLPLRLQLLARL